MKISVTKGALLTALLLFTLPVEAFGDATVDGFFRRDLVRSGVFEQTASGSTPLSVQPISVEQQKDGVPLGPGALRKKTRDRSQPYLDQMQRELQENGLRGVRPANEWDVSRSGSRNR